MIFDIRYIENVFPGKYGVPRKWYFFVTRTYWCGLPSKDDGGSITIPVTEMVETKLEAEPTHLNLGVSMQNLKKVYRYGTTVYKQLLTEIGIFSNIFFLSHDTVCWLLQRHCLLATTAAITMAQ